MVCVVDEVQIIVERKCAFLSGYLLRIDERSKMLVIVFVQLAESVVSSAERDSLLILFRPAVIDKNMERIAWFGIGVDKVPINHGEVMPHREVYLCSEMPVIVQRQIEPGRGIEPVA